MKELEKKKISHYLLNIIASYLSNRAVMVDGRKKNNISAGVPQGSNLGPTLWNVLYDGILKISMPAKVTTIAFADDLALIAVAKKENILTNKINTALKNIDLWLTKNGLEPAPENTEAIMLTGRRRLQQTPFMFRGTRIFPSKTIKYLGVVLDESRKMTKHIEYVVSKADKIITQLTRAMPNIKGPRASKRKILGSVGQSIILYGAPIWLPATRSKRHLQMIKKCQRKMALRICSAYRTVSTEAALVLANLTPLELIARERAYKYRNKSLIQKPELRRRATENTIVRWQRAWETTTRANWTKTLIPNLKPWITRNHGEVNYHITQALTAHGSFGT